jgi:hypothetical protein
MRDERDEKLAASAGNPIERPSAAQTVERVGPNEFDTVARILAAAYTNDPIHIWSLPNAATRLADATVFFKFYLKRMRPQNWDVWVTSDRSAALITSIVRKGDKVYLNDVRHLPSLVRKISPVNDYFEWLETFRPNVDHWYGEFLGARPDAPRGSGMFLLANVLKMSDRDGLPYWTWSSNPLNLPFFRFLGFEIGEEVRRDDDTPPVHIILHPPMPLRD